MNYHAYVNKHYLTLNFKNYSAYTVYYKLMLLKSMTLKEFATKSFKLVNILFLWILVAII